MGFSGTAGRMAGIAVILLSGCVTPQEAGIPDTNENRMKLAAQAYWEASIGVTQGDYQTDNLPTTGTATYAGGSYFDLTQEGDAQGQMVFNQLAFVAAFRNGGGTVSGELTDATLVTLNKDDYDDIADALADRGISKEAFEVRLDSAMKQAIRASMTGSASISETEFVDFNINSTMGGAFSNDEVEMMLDAPIYGFFTGDDGETIRVTGTNFGNIEAEVNGTKQNVYFDGYAASGGN